MDIKSDLDNGLNYIMSTGGLSSTINIISYSIASGSYDDDTTQTLIGSNVISGLVFPIKGSYGSSEALLLSEGKLLTNDKMLYTGSVNISGNILIDIKGSKYSVVPDGIHTYEINGSTIYNKMYIRQSTTGSLY